MILEFYHLELPNYCLTKLTNYQTTTYSDLIKNLDTFPHRYEQWSCRDARDIQHDVYKYLIYLFTITIQVVCYAVHTLLRYASNAHTST